MDEEINRYKEHLINADVPIWEKKWLNIEEAAAYSGIGQIKLRELAMQRQCRFVVMNGTQICIVRQKFDDFIDKQFKI